MKKAKVLVCILSLALCVCMLPMVQMSVLAEDTNLITNGSFETGDATAWTATDASVITGTLVGWAIDGDYLISVGATQKNGVGSGLISQEIAVTAGTIYDVGATYRQNNGNNNGVTTDFTMTVTDSDGAVLFTETKTVARANSNVVATGSFYVQTSGTVTVTIATSSSCTGTRPGSFQNLVDAVSVTPGVEKAFENGSFETGDLTGWTVTDSSAIAAATIGWAIDGDYVALLGQTKSGSSVSGSISQQITVTPGTVYSLGATYRQNNGNNNGVTANFTMTVTGGDSTVLFSDNKTVARANGNVTASGEFYTGDNFTVTVTIACAATATVTPGSFQNVVDNISVTTRDVAEFQNGSFETGDLTGWTSEDAATVTGTLVGWGMDGDYLTSVGGTQKNGVGAGWIAQEFVVTPGLIYNIGAIYRQNNGAGNGVTTNFTMTVTGYDGTVLFTDNKTVARANGNVVVGGAFNVGSNCTVTVKIETSSSCTGTRPGSFQNLVDGVEVFRASEIVGAQIRESDNALRFVMKADQNVLERLTARYGAEKVEVGTVMVNNDKFTGDALVVTDKTSGFGSANPTTIANTSAFVPAGMAYAGSKVYTAVIRQLDTEEKKATSVAVRAYIKVTGDNNIVRVYYSQDNQAHGGYATTYNAVEAASDKVA